MYQTLPASYMNPRHSGVVGYSPVVAPPVERSRTRYKRGMAGQGPYTYPDNEVFNDDQALLSPPFQFCWTKRALFYDLSKNLKMVAKAKHKVVHLSTSRSQMLPVLLNIKTQDLTAKQLENRSPIDLICVVDVSGSMMGEKLKLLQNTLLGLKNHLKERDRLCLIQFNTNARRLTPLMLSNKKNWEVFKKVIEGLEADGENTIPGGMDLAFKVLNERKEANPISSIFLLSDGIEDGADVEVTERMNIRKMEDVNFTINTFGFGHDHDQDLLTTISKQKKGEFYFINQLYTIDECFAASFAGLTSIVAKEVNITIRNITEGQLSGISIEKTYSDAWTKVSNKEYKIKIPYLHSGVDKGFIMELNVPPIYNNIPDNARNIPVLEVFLQGKDSSGVNHFVSQAYLVIRVVNEKGQIGQIEEDHEVMNHYYRVLSGQVVSDAIQLGTRGDYNTGAANIRQMRNQITSYGTANNQNLQPLLQRLATTEACMDPKNFQTYGRKLMTEKVQTCFNQQVDLAAIGAPTTFVPTTTYTTTECVPYAVREAVQEVRQRRPV